MTFIVLHLHIIYVIYAGDLSFNYYNDADDSDSAFISLELSGFVFMALFYFQSLLFIDEIAVSAL